MQGYRIDLRMCERRCCISGEVWDLTSIQRRYSVSEMCLKTRGEDNSRFFDSVTLDLERNRRARVSIYLLNSLISRLPARTFVMKYLLCFRSKLPTYI